MDDGHAIPVEIGHIVDAEGKSAPDLINEALAAGRAIVQVGFDAARRRATEAARLAYPGRHPATEEDVAAEALRLTREAHAVTG